ncbi:MAG: hypothetical protein OXU86_04395, partial [Thaumarchaeota archaeon]|nr:hypothetical protein [Nitrososphaerota archaeon]
PKHTLAPPSGAGPPMESLTTFAVLVAASAAAAAAAWVVIRSKFPRTPFQYSCDAYMLAIRGFHSDALRLYNKAIAGFARAETTMPTYMSRSGYRVLSLTHAWKSITLASLGRPDDALASSERAIELDSTDRRVQVARATALHAAGMNAELLDLANGHLEKDASDVNMHLYRAIALLTDGEVDPAIEALSKAVELAPHSGVLHSTYDIVKRDSEMRELNMEKARIWLLEDIEKIDEIARHSELFMA